jgi:integrase
MQSSMWETPRAVQEGWGATPFVKLKPAQNGKRHVLQNPMTGKPFLDFGRSWKTLLSGTGIDGVRFHDCRHTFASHFLMNGGDLYTLKELLGHKGPTFVSRLRLKQKSPLVGHAICKTCWFITAL